MTDWQARAEAAEHVLKAVVNMDELRQLRLWHHRKVQGHSLAVQRGQELLSSPKFNSKDKAEVKLLKSRIREHRKTVALHEQAVKTLNDLFPIGDTAEDDERKANGTVCGI